MPDKTKKSPRLKTSEIFTLAAEYERQAEIEGRAKKTKKELGDNIAGELLARKTKSLTHSDGTTVTRVQSTNIVINDATLYGDLTPAQRRKVYRRSLDISALPAAAQKAIVEALREHKASKAVKHTLDHTALAAEVQAGNIEPEIVAAHSNIVENAPYVRISHGTGE